MVNAKKLELIEELKVLRQEKGMTYQQIADATEKLGCPVSLSTIKLVFNDNYNHNHDYINTLKPIADVLNPPSEDDSIEIKTLQTELELKEAQIAQLEKINKENEQKYKDREQFLMKLIEQLHSEISFKNDQIRHHNAALDSKDNAIKELYSILIGQKSEKDVFS